MGLGIFKKTPEQIEYVYINVLTFFKPLNVNFILAYGSLLGYYRENNFINNDDDIDVLVSRQDSKKILNFLKNNNNPKIKIRQTSDVILIIFENKCPFEIFIYDVYEDSILIKGDNNVLYKNEDMFPLININFKTIDISIPSNTEKILFLTYGINWKIPQTKFIDYNPYNISDDIRLRVNRRYKIPNIRFVRCSFKN
jgi:phosphorylcholine metabolism protein LicD